MKKLILIAFMVLMVSSVFAADVSIVPTFAEAGEDTELFVRVTNPSSKDLDDVRVVMYIPDFDIYEVSNSFDINDGSSATAVFFVTMPEDVELGYYPVIVNIYGDNVRDRQITWLALI